MRMVGAVGTVLVTVSGLELTVHVDAVGGGLQHDAVALGDEGTAEVGGADRMALTIQPY